MLLNTYYNLWNQSFTIQMKFKHISHSHMIMVKTEIYSLITTLSPCNSIFPNQFLLTLCTISKSTSRWTNLVKIIMPNSSWIVSKAHPKFQLSHLWNILHLAILANSWIQIFPSPPQNRLRPPWSGVLSQIQAVGRRLFFHSPPAGNAWRWRYFLWLPQTNWRSPQNRSVCVCAGRGECLCADLHPFHAQEPRSAVHRTREKLAVAAPGTLRGV